MQNMLFMFKIIRAFRDAQHYASGFRICVLAPSNSYASRSWATCEWWAEGSAQGAHKHRGAVPDPRGGRPPPRGGSKSARHLRIPLIHPKSASGFPADL